MPTKRTPASLTPAALKAAPKLAPKNASQSAGKPKPINIALQGGGSQGAYSWGVVDQLLLDERVEIEAISGTSAGAINGVLLAYGLAAGGRDKARQVMREFWRKLSVASEFTPFRASPLDKFLGNYDLRYSPSFLAMEYLTTMFSPYQLNIMDINPLREILLEVVDFDVVRRCKKLKLFVNATHVRTGKAHIFRGEDLTVDMVMASACLPHLFKTVWVNDEPYWDGGYSGNPSIFPLIYNCATPDVLVVQINAMYQEEVPQTAAGILDRLNELNFNAALMSEMRAISFVSKLKDQGTLGEEYKDMHVHLIDAQDIMGDLGRMSKLNADWGFLSYLYDVGVQSATDWLDTNYDKIGKESSIDLNKVYL